MPLAPYVSFIEDIAYVGAPDKSVPVSGIQQCLPCSIERSPARETEDPVVIAPVRAC
jgi:hypothetical protein